MTQPLHSPLGGIALNAIRWRSGEPDIGYAILRDDVRWLLRYIEEAEAAAPDPAERIVAAAQEWEATTDFAERDFGDQRLLLALAYAVAQDDGRAGDAGPDLSTAAPDPVASPNEAVNAAIRILRDLSPDAEWIEKFYAALEAMAWLATGHELVAEGTPPHVVMARFIDDLAWRTVASPPEAVELLRELVALLDESGHPEWVDLDAAEDTLAEAHRYLADSTGVGTP